MRYSALVAIAALGIFTADAHAARVVAFGDSWASMGAGYLAEVFVNHGHPEMTVANRGVGGSTAAGWAAKPSALPDAVTANPDAEFVWLSIGGNDVYDHFFEGDPTFLKTDNERNIRAILDALFAVHPDITVVSFGYDLPNLVHPACLEDAARQLGLPPPTAPLPQGLADLVTLAANYGSFDQFDDVYAGIAAEVSQVDYAPLWGALQAAGGLEGAPRLGLPSPSELMVDCIHPTGEGFRAIMDAFYARYWGPLLDGADAPPPPVPSCAVVPEGGGSPLAFAPVVALLVGLGGRRASRRFRKH
ncbi:MAG: SGNH/GDSL hydrolase family protein [Myxococcales bacterium]|nr:SGNH/GDSL hydrolase family protein [Myxococcales bacterium]